MDQSQLAYNQQDDMQLLDEFVNNLLPASSASGMQAFPTSTFADVAPTSTSVNPLQSMLQQQPQQQQQMASQLASLASQHPQAFPLAPSSSVSAATAAQQPYVSMATVTSQTGAMSSHSGTVYVDPNGAVSVHSGATNSPTAAAAAASEPKRYHTPDSTAEPVAKRSASSHSYAASVQSLASQPGALASRDAVRRYLDTYESEESDQVVTIVHSRVVQKSYGTEKRFFCPPPSIALNGARWRNPAFGAPHAFISMATPDSESEYTPLALDSQLYSTAKTLYIPDSDKRKSFCLHLKVFFESGRDVGTFASKPIKVISKPPKKKQSTTTNPDMCIENKGEISLFNRVRSQSGNSKYLLGTPQGQLIYDKKEWDTFKIIQHHDGARPRSHAPCYIMYGDVVLLQAKKSNVMFGPYKVCKTDKNVVDAKADDPVSQLQKIALLVVGTERDYLTITDQGVNPVTCSDTAPNGAHRLTENSCWTLVSCDRYTFRFYDPQFETSQSTVMTPVPVVDYVKCLGKTVELFGVQFSSLMQVWFGDVPAKTFYRCKELLMCVPPPYKDVRPASDGICRSPTPVELLLVRNDGVIFRTGHKYTYEIDQVALLRAVLESRQQQQQLDSSERSSPSSMNPGVPSGQTP
eukprot:m.110639 g.110639  ORF g.110639 m.110639 type:complete len:635 (-) comp13405_c0_seq3:403-2307(-)